MRRLVLSVAAWLPLTAMLPAQPPAGAARLNPCTLVSKADVQQAVGQDVADQKVNPNNAAVCGYQVGDFGSVSFLVSQPRPGETPDKVMAELQKRKIPVAVAPGIGDRSFFASPGYGMTQLNTYKGPHYIILTILIPNAGEQKQKAVADKLMRKVVSKL